VVAQKGRSGVLDVVTGHIGHVSCHLGSLLSAIELIVLCVFVCKVGFFDAQIKGHSIVQVRDLTYLSIWGDIPNSLHGNLHSSSFPLFHLLKILHKFQATLSG
jgi:hypothetical protein